MVLKTAGKQTKTKDKNENISVESHKSTMLQDWWAQSCSTLSSEIHL